MDAVFVIVYRDGFKDRDQDDEFVACKSDDEAFGSDGFHEGFRKSDEGLVTFFV